MSDPRPSKRIRGGGPLAAVVSKFATAAGTFLLQAWAARSLGAAGLGTFALVYSLVILIASISNGLIGDSLTVLDRKRDDIRAGLIGWCGINALGVSAIVAALLVRFNGTSVASGLLFVAVTTCFVVESAFRRLLQAHMMFWGGVVMETVGSVASLVAVGVWVAIGPVNLTTFVVALGVGQLVATIAAILYLPHEERRWPRFRGAAMGTVAAFGFWRAAQQGLRPGVLTAVRFLVVLTASKEALGELEAARVYMSPALLMVQGISSYLFSSYAQRRHRSAHELIRRADVATIGLAVATLVCGTIAALLSPVLGQIVTGSSFSMTLPAVFGWALYAAASAAVTPYQGLAAVRGKQSLVMGLRCIDAVSSLIAFALLALVFGAPPVVAPYVLAIGSCLGGWLVRRYALVPLTAEEPDPLPSGASA